MLNKSIVLLLPLIFSMMASGTAKASECMPLKDQLQYQVRAHDAVLEYYQVQAQFLDKSKAAVYASEIKEERDSLAQLMVAQVAVGYQSNYLLKAALSQFVKKESNDGKTDTCDERERQLRNSIPFIEISKQVPEVQVLFYAKKINKRD